MVPVKDERILKEDCAELCGLFSKYWRNAQMMIEDGTNSLVGMFVDDPVPLSIDNLEGMANSWVFVKEDSLVVNSIIDNELELDDEGHNNGDGVG